MNINEFADNGGFAVKVRHLKSVPVTYCISREYPGARHRTEWVRIGRWSIQRIPWCYP